LQIGRFSTNQNDLEKRISGSSSVEPNSNARNLEMDKTHSSMRDAGYIGGYFVLWAALLMLLRTRYGFGA
jgi:hypothetical protein